jgi:hypothetical protein
MLDNTHPNALQESLAALEFYTRKARLLHKIELCNRKLKSLTDDVKRLRYQLKLKSYTEQLYLLNKPC